MNRSVLLGVVVAAAAAVLVLVQWLGSPEAPATSPVDPAAAAADENTETTTSELQSGLVDAQAPVPTREQSERVEAETTRPKPSAGTPTDAVLLVRVVEKQSGQPIAGVMVVGVSHEPPGTNP